MYRCAERLHCALGTAKGRAEPIYDEKHLETHINQAESSGGSSGDHTQSYMGWRLVISISPDLERVLILALAVGEVAVLEHGS